MGAVLIALIGAIASLALPVLIFWYIATHFQQIVDAVKQAATLPGIAVGSVVSPLVIGGIAFFGAIGIIAGGIWYEEHKVDRTVKAPTFAPISAATFPYQAATSAASYAPYPYVGYAGGGFSAGARNAFGAAPMSVGGPRPLRAGSFGGSSGGGGSRPARTAAPVANRPARR